MLKFIRRLKADRQRREALRKEAVYNRGFDYAAGALLRNEMSPRDLEAQYIGFPGDSRDDFDRGMVAAVSLLVSQGIAVDNRSL